MPRAIAFIRHWIFALLIAQFVGNSVAGLIFGNGLSAAVSIISTIVILSILIIDLKRKGGMNSWLVVEMGALALLWILCIVAAAKANTVQTNANSLGHKSDTISYGSYYPSSSSCKTCGGGVVQISSFLWPAVAFITIQIVINATVAFTSGNRVTGSVWFGPTSNLFHKEEDEKTKSKVYKDANTNEGGHGVKAPASLVASSSATVTGYNNNPAHQGYPPSPSTPQGTYSRRNHAQVDEYVDMANTGQYEKAQYSHQQAATAYPTSPISPYN